MENFSTALGEVEIGSLYADTDSARPAGGLTIKKKWGEFTKTGLFNISQGAGCTLMKNVPDGTELHVLAAVIMTDEQLNVETGETKKKDILHIKTEDGIYTTESPTIIGTFTAAVEFMGDHQLTFILMRGTSKNGRQFMDLQLKE